MGRWPLTGLEVLLAARRVVGPEAAGSNPPKPIPFDPLGTTPIDTEDLAAVVAAVPHWHHAIDFGGGVVAPGVKTPARLRLEWESMRLPDLRGKSVLDVGAWDGWFSFEAERAGASRVVSLDHYIWCVDWSKIDAYAADCRARGVPKQPWHKATHGVWRPDTLPGRFGYELAYQATGSKAEVFTADIGDLNELGLSVLGTFDVVFFMGVLYHVPEPIRVLEQAARLTRPGGLCVIETEAVEVAGSGDAPFCHFFPAASYHDDPTIFWVPNRAAVVALCRAAGFSRVDVLTDPPEAGHYRCYAHAYR